MHVGAEIYLLMFTSTLFIQQQLTPKMTDAAATFSSPTDGHIPPPTWIITHATPQLLTPVQVTRARHLHPLYDAECASSFSARRSRSHPTRTGDPRPTQSSATTSAMTRTTQQARDYQWRHWTPNLQTLQLCDSEYKLGRP